MAAIAEKYQPEGETLNRRILRRRTVLLVLATIADVASGLFQAADLGQMMKMEMPFGLLTIALGVLLAVTLIVIVMIMFSLFQLRRYVRNWGEAEPPFPAE